MMPSCGKKILVEYKSVFCGSLSSLKAGALDRNPLFTEPLFIQSNEKYSKVYWGKLPCKEHPPDQNRLNVS